MAKGKERLDLSCIKAPIANEYSFPVLTNRGSVIMQRVGGRILQGLREGYRQLSGRVGVSNQNVGDCVTTFHSRVPHLNDRRNSIDPRHLDGRAAQQYERSPRVQACNPRDKLILSLVKRHIPAIGALEVILMIQSTVKENGICRLDGRHQRLILAFLPVPGRNPAHLDANRGVAWSQFHSKLIGRPASNSTDLCTVSLPPSKR